MLFQVTTSAPVWLCMVETTRTWCIGAYRRPAQHGSHAVTHPSGDSAIGQLEHRTRDLFQTLT